MGERLDADGLYRLIASDGRIAEHLLIQFLADPGGGGFDQLLARLEMLIRGASVDARALRDSGDTEAFLAILSQHFSRGLENRLARTLRIAHPSGSPDCARRSAFFRHRVLVVERLPLRPRRCTGC